MTREHSYYVGAGEDNRNPMVEALVANFRVSARMPAEERREEQLALLEK